MIPPSGRTTLPPSGANKVQSRDMGVLNTAIYSKTSNENRFFFSNNIPRVTEDYEEERMCSTDTLCCYAVYNQHQGLEPQAGHAQEEGAGYKHAHALPLLIG